ncbi:insulin-like growth factor-binding protein complex acid labile subunit isoform X2 [Anneissia japonica]|uniref:insulin-like growth factor-binding protein complex acid labile subunit isoform X2 n=1 Tax=Anneissia japonica TaxID=1529436 RepID=UPI0014257ADF|nr:insulin-like growth factor-binding protein complex acid labile subunit isoform X2 [Anneissia japonica]
MRFRLALTVIVIYTNIGHASCQNYASCVHDNRKTLLCECKYFSSGWVFVNCTKRGLTNFPAGIPENATHLYLDNNTITDIGSDALLRLNRLQEISLNFNKLTRLPMFPKHIHVISAEFNLLQSIDGAFANLTQLDRINMHKNPLEYIEPYTFEDLYHLNEILLGDTAIRELKENAFFMSSHAALTIVVSGKFLRNISTGTFRNIPSGSKIYVWWSTLTTIPARVINGGYLDKLTFEHNVIQDVHPDAFIEMEGVDELCLKDNRLTVFPPALYNLRIRRTMYLQSNSIFSLGSGPIVKYSPQTIVMHDNRIESISRDNFRGLKNLEMIMLSRNKISYIEDGAFYGTDLRVMLVIHILYLINYIK